MTSPQPPIQELALQDVDHESSQTDKRANHDNNNDDNNNNITDEDDEYKSSEEMEQESGTCAGILPVATQAVPTESQAEIPQVEQPQAEQQPLENSVENIALSPTTNEIEPVTEPGPEAQAQETENEEEVIETIPTETTNTSVENPASSTLPLVLTRLEPGRIQITTAHATKDVYLTPLQTKFEQELHPNKVETKVSEHEQTIEFTCYNRCSKVLDTNAGFATHYCVDCAHAFCSSCIRRVHELENPHFRSHKVYTTRITCSFLDCESVASFKCFACHVNEPKGVFYCMLHTALIHGGSHFKFHVTDRQLFPLTLKEQYPYELQEQNDSDRQLSIIQAAALVPLAADQQQAEPIHLSEDYLRASAHYKNSRHEKINPSDHSTVDSTSDSSSESESEKPEELPAPRPASVATKTIPLKRPPKVGARTSSRTAPSGMKAQASTKKKKPKMSKANSAAKAVARAVAQTKATIPLKIIFSTRTSPKTPPLAEMSPHSRKLQYRKPLQRNILQMRLVNRYTDAIKNEPLSEAIDALDSALLKIEIPSIDSLTAISVQVAKLMLELNLYTNNYTNNTDVMKMAPLPAVAVYTNALVYKMRSGGYKVKTGQAPLWITDLPQQICNTLGNACTFEFKAQHIDQVEPSNDHDEKNGSDGICISFIGSHAVCQMAGILMKETIRMTEAIFDQLRHHRKEENEIGLEPTPIYHAEKGIANSVAAVIHMKCKQHLHSMLGKQTVQEHTSSMGVTMMRFALSEFKKELGSQDPRPVPQRWQWVHQYATDYVAKQIFNVDSIDLDNWRIYSFKATLPSLMALGNTQLELLRSLQKRDEGSRGKRHAKRNNANVSDAESTGKQTKKRQVSQVIDKANHQEDIVIEEEKGEAATPPTQPIVATNNKHLSRPHYEDDEIDYDEDESCGPDVPVEEEPVRKAEEEEEKEEAEEGEIMETHQENATTLVAA